MKMRKMGAAILAAAGVVMIGFSMYIKSEVASGQERIDNAQRSVDRANSLFSIAPYGKDVGQGLTGMAQNKIDAGSAEAAYYANMARVLQFGGIICIIAGGLLFFFPRKNA